MRALLILPLLALAAPAFAQEAPVLKVYGCAAVAGEKERLACFDGAVAALKAAEARGDVTIVSKQQLATAQKENFGLAAPPSVAQSVARATTAAPAPGVAKPAPAPKVEDDKPDRVTLQVKAIARGADGRLTVVMENGQVWKQSDDMKLAGLGQGPWTAEVRKGAVGTFLMNINGRTAIRVKRVS
jgi:hypothetical protein